MTTAAAPLYDLDAPAPKDTYKLRAYEIWGGNGAVCQQALMTGFDAWLYSKPYGGSAAGGDLRFVSACAAGQIIRFAIADLAGHGEEASGLAMGLQSLMRKHINTPDPSKFVRALNVELTRLQQQGRFATAVIQTYFAPTDHFIVCNAGHPRPLLYRARTAAWELLDEKSAGMLEAARAKETGIVNLPLGILAPTTFPQFATHLEPGDVVVSYTDSFIEASDAGGRPLGESGLLGLVRGVSPDDPAKIGEAILAGVTRWRGGKQADDDETLLVLKHNASNPPDGAWAKMRALGRLVGLVK
jgi:serine phosphatase RsbU (regulator of sigma subunit)